MLLSVFGLSVRRNSGCYQEENSSKEERNIFEGEQFRGPIGDGQFSYVQESSAVDFIHGQMKREKRTRRLVIDPSTRVDSSLLLKTSYLNEFKPPPTPPHTQGTPQALRASCTRKTDSHGSGLRPPGMKAQVSGSDSVRRTCKTW